MFDLSDPALTRLKKRTPPLPPAPAEEPEPVSGQQHPLDSPEAVKIHQRLLDCYVRELDRQEENRREQAKDEDFYDNIQWDEDDIRLIEDRGQKATVYNVLATTVNWILGTERRGRTDFSVLPRGKEDAGPAERKTQLLKYLSDCNRTRFHRSRAFADAVKVGIGWLEDGWDDDKDGEPVYSRYESWRNMLYDSAATELDLQDARYIFRSKWVDYDLAVATFADRAGVIERAASVEETFLSSFSGFYGDEPMDAAELEMERIGSLARFPNRFYRRRLRLIEGWFRHPQIAKRLRGGQFDGELFDPFSPGHVEHVQSGRAEIVEKPTMRMHVALFTTVGLLYLAPSPYRHNRYPFTPIWGNRRGRNGLPYGLIRGLRSVQESINKRASKALYHLTARRTIVEEGAVDDMDALAEEAARPDAFIVLKTGKNLKIEDGRALSAAELEMMSRDIMMVQQVGGVTDENLGRRTNATSGVAIERRQDQGASSTAHYFDNLRLAMQIQGEKQLSLVEQFFTEQKQFRITNMRGTPQYVAVNDGLPENDVTRSKADYVISEGDWHATIRQAQAEQLLETMVKLPPQVGAVMLDLVVENMDLPNRDEIVRRLRDELGVSDPDADENDPEQVARKQAQARKAQIADAMQQAQLRKLVAEAVAKEMDALASRAAAVATNVKAIGGPKRGAVDIAADIMSAPAAAPVADALLKESGFEGAPEEAAAAIATPQANAQAARLAQQQQQGEANGQA